MANGTQSIIVGVGTVLIHMFDAVVRTVTRVRHVPGLKTNPISLGPLDVKGYQYSFKRGVLNLSKGAMVVPKGEMSRGLHRLVGNVQAGGATGRTTTSDSSERQVARRKWVTLVSLTKGCDDPSGSS